MKQSSFLVKLKQFFFGDQEASRCCQDCLYFYPSNGGICAHNMHQTCDSTGKCVAPKVSWKFDSICRGELWEEGLKSCPFCGGTPELKHGAPGCWFVQCSFCEASTNDAGSDRAVKIWNSRTKPERRP